jgi:hypothetical protein
MSNVKLENSWWEPSNYCLYLQYSIDDKLINLIFSKEIVDDIFHDTCNSGNIKKDLEEAKNKVIKTIETKDKKLNYLIQEALKDKIVQEQLIKREVGQFTIEMKYFYSHKNSNGIEIYKDYR